MGAGAVSLEQLIGQRTDLWRGSDRLPSLSHCVPSGFEGLDRETGGGWPRGALTEILCDREGSGALRLVMPALARLSLEERWIAWVGPPHIPYAPALAGRGLGLSRILLIRASAPPQNLWALEQALCSGACSAVLAWPGIMEAGVLRRLQLAAESGDALGFLFLPGRGSSRATPAALRLGVRALAQGLEVRILKRRGGWKVDPLVLEWDSHE